MLKMTAEVGIFDNRKDTCHSVFVNNKRIGGVYVYQQVSGEVTIIACHAYTMHCKIVHTLTDGVKWLVVKEVFSNEG